MRIECYIAIILLFLFSYYVCIQKCLKTTNHSFNGKSKNILRYLFTIYIHTIHVLCILMSILNFNYLFAGNPKYHYNRKLNPNKNQHLNIYQYDYG